MQILLYTVAAWVAANLVLMLWLTLVYNVSSLREAAQMGMLRDSAPKEL